EIAAVLIAQRAEAPVVEDEDVGAGKAREEPEVAPVGVREGEFLEEARDAAVEGAIALAARLLREGAGEVRLAGARGAGDEHVVMLGDPAAGREMADQRLVEFPAGRAADRLDAGLAAPH